MKKLKDLNSKEEKIYNSLLKGKKFTVICGENLDHRKTFIYDDYNQTFMSYYDYNKNILTHVFENIVIAKIHKTIKRNKTYFLYG